MMASVLDGSMPPRPDCDFNFILPHGIDNEGDTSATTRDRQMSSIGQDDHDMDDIFQSVESYTHNDSNVDNENNAQQAMNYDTFQPGFSDDEGDEKAFDRSWTAHQARRVPPKNKKSPRRSEDGDGDGAASPKTKKPRQSLFGGQVRESGDEEHEEYVDDQNDGLSVPKTPGAGIRHHMSSMNLDQQEAQENRNFNLGFSLTTSERDSMSPAASRAASEESLVIPPDDQPAYELRKHIDRSKTFTYIDNDKTGNYDPSEEAKQKAIRLQKAKAAKEAKAAKKKVKTKEKIHKEAVKKYIIKLHFKAFGNVRNYTNDEDNWPNDWSDVDSDCERERKENQEFYRRNSPCLKVQTSINDPSGVLDDLTGYPAARGCKLCRKLGQPCSMIDGGTYPCEHCQDEDNECEPILEPIFKGRCKQCIKDGEETCSFEQDPDKAICAHCLENQSVCDALPPNGYKNPRNSIDDIMYGPDRKHTQCNFCRSEKKRCSLKKKIDKPPCKHCKKNGIGCTFYSLPKKTVERKAAAKKRAVLRPTEGDVPKVSKPGSEFFSLEDLEDMKNNDEEVLSREATPEIEMEDEAGNKGMLTKIKTSFAHPIQFSATDQQASDCNFCEMSLFGFVGHFEREVHVIRYYNGLGYTEVGGGHCENNGQTTMCLDCTNTRLQIVVCPKHELQTISDDTATQDFDGVADELICAEPGSSEVRYQLQRWCTMCFSVATYGCATIQLLLTEENEDMEVVGCGLRLCDKCAETLRDKHYWNLEAMVDEMDSMPKTSEEDEQSGALPGKARADVGFLSNQGLLMRCVYVGGDGNLA